MSNTVIFLLLIFTCLFMGVLYFRARKEVQKLKLEGNGVIKQDAAFDALIEFLVEIIPEMLDTYKLLVSEAKTNKEKIEHLVTTIADDIMRLIEEGKDKDPRLELVYKLTRVVPSQLIYTAVVNAVGDFVIKYIETGDEREAAIINAVTNEEEKLSEKQE